MSGLVLYETGTVWHHAIWTTLAVICGIVWDLIIGDPAWLPHPVVWMGRCIRFLERHLRQFVSRHFLRKTEETRMLFAGGMMVFVLCLLSFAIPGTILFFAGRLHPLLAFVLEGFWCGQCLACRGLYAEGKAVREVLLAEGLPAGRKQVARIVGRDTQQLSREGVLRADIETVAENSSDGIIAPLFYMLLGGAPLALLYKAVNTMDSMCGYKNERYLYFGRPAARLDDAANFLPARITAAFWVLAASLLPFADGRQALAAWKRDGSKTESPNAGQAEAACAGALGIRLGGPLSYFGEQAEKPWLFAEGREVEPEDVEKTLRLMAVAYASAALTGILIRAMILGGMGICVPSI